MFFLRLRTLQPTNWFGAQRFKATTSSNDLNVCVANIEDLTCVLMFYEIY